jgi:hypothetical protein
LPLSDRPKGKDRPNGEDRPKDKDCPPGWNGLGAALSNARFQSAAAADLTPESAGYSRFGEAPGNVLLAFSTQSK